MRIETMLDQLHQAKETLDDIIRGLEKVGSSPHYQLVENLTQARENGDCVVSLDGQRQRELVRLAKLVGDGNGRDRRRQGKSSAARRRIEHRPLRGSRLVLLRKTAGGSE